MYATQALNLELKGPANKGYLESMVRQRKWCISKWLTMGEAIRK